MREFQYDKWAKNVKLYWKSEGENPVRAFEWNDWEIIDYHQKWSYRKDICGQKEGKRT